MNCTQVCSSIW